MEKGKDKNKEKYSACFWTMLIMVVLSLIVLSAFILAIQQLFKYSQIYTKVFDPRWIMCALIFLGICLVLLEAGMLGLAFFFAWQRYKITSHNIKMEEKEYDQKIRLEEHDRLDREAEKRRKYEQQRSNQKNI